MLLFGQNETRDDAFEHELTRLAALVTDIGSIRDGVSPEALADADAPILDRWVFGQRLVPCLAGMSTGHPKLPGANRLIGTSDLWLLSEDRSWARTLSRWYRLGRPADQADLHS
jgi:hypothetical protein